MKLYIDTSNTEKIIVGLGSRMVHEDSRVNKSQMLLPLIIGLLDQTGNKLQDITEIDVNLGPGSFTGLRVGISVGNALAQALDIPINGSKKLVEPVY